MVFLFIFNHKILTVLNRKVFREEIKNFIYMKGFYLGRKTRKRPIKMWEQ